MRLRAGSSSCRRRRVTRRAVDRRRSRRRAEVLGQTNGVFTTVALRSCPPPARAAPCPRRRAAASRTPRQMAALDRTGEIVLLVTPPTCVLLVVVQRRAGDREAVVVHAQADDLLGDLLAGVHAGDDLLAEVAALRHADGAGELPGRSRRAGRTSPGRRVAEVDVEQRPARLDARRVERGPADRAGACRLPISADSPKRETRFIQTVRGRGDVERSARSPARRRGRRGRRPRRRRTCARHDRPERRQLAHVLAA